MKITWSKEPSDFINLLLTLYPTRKREICPEPPKKFSVRQLCRKLRQGKKEKAIPHIGFSIDKDKNYHVDPITSPYIVEAFTMYDEGRTMKEIVAVLNQHGLKNQRGGELNLNSVSRLLQNRFYIGEYKYREVLVPDGIPAIIQIRYEHLYQFRYS